MTIERWQEPTITVPHHVINFSDLCISMDFGPTVPLSEREGLGEMLSTDNALFRLGSPMDAVTQLHSTVPTNSAAQGKARIGGSHG